MKIKGNANHQDFAAVGVAVPDVLQGHRVMLQKGFGGNGWRYGITLMFGRSFR